MRGALFFAGTACAVALAGCAVPATGPAAKAGCPAPAASMNYTDATPVRRIRIYTDPRTHDSAFEEAPMAPKRTPLLKTGKILYEYDFGKGSKVQIVAAPADLVLPLHPAPYRESFLMLEGSVTMELGDGSRRELVAGDMTTFEDIDATRGHGGKTGPCGYVALNIVP